MFEGHLAASAATRAAGRRRRGRGRRGGRRRLSARRPGVPRDWTDLFIAADGSAPPDGGDEDAAPRRGLFRRLRENLAKTRQALGSEIQATLFQTLDDETWERLEEALIMADVGAATTAAVVAQLETEATDGDLSG